MSGVNDVIVNHMFGVYSLGRTRYLPTKRSGTYSATTRAAGPSDCATLSLRDPSLKPGCELMRRA